jgi:uncharacterized ion transporter superfamily protein YfcC
MGRASLERGSMGNGLMLFINIASMAVVIWGVIDVARRPASRLAPRWKALWIAGMVGGWLLFGIIGAIVSVFYLAGPRKRLNAGEYSGRY